MSFPKGKHHSGKSKKKISQTRKGHFVSEQTKRKIGLANKIAIKRLWQNPEYREKMSGTHKGQKAWNRNKKETRLEVLEKMSRVKIGKCRGEKSPSWKGGITPLAKQIRNCLKYRQWISDIFTRDDFTCQRCGIRGGKLVAHHIKLFSKILRENNIKTFEEALNCEEMWNINNGRTLCKNYHLVLHKTDKI